MELSLISSNIRFDSPNDGPRSWAYRRNFLAKILLEYGPQIIGTQEGRIDQLQDLHSLLPDFLLLDQHRPWIKERMYPCLYIRREFFEVLDSGDTWLSETPDVVASKSFNSTFPRLMTWAKLQIKESTSKILVINTHLDHIEETTRIEQCQVLINQINRLWDKTSFLILLGDFNTSPYSEVMKLILNELPELQDSWKIQNKIEEASFHAFLGTVDYAQRIDWIMTDKRFEVLESHMDKRQEKGIYPSDHYPVITKVKF